MQPLLLRYPSRSGSGSTSAVVRATTDSNKNSAMAKETAQARQTSSTNLLRLGSTLRFWKRTFCVEAELFQAVTTTLAVAQGDTGARQSANPRPFPDELSRERAACICASSSALLDDSDKPPPAGLSKGFLFSRPSTIHSPALGTTRTRPRCDSRFIPVAGASMDGLQKAWTLSSNLNLSATRKYPGEV